MADSTSSHSGEKHAEEKEKAQIHLENVKTNERVPGHPAYYEKDGLRTYGDDEDHDHEPPVSTTRQAVWDKLTVSR